MYRQSHTLTGTRPPPSFPALRFENLLTSEFLHPCLKADSSKALPFLKSIDTLLLDLRAPGKMNVIRLQRFVAISVEHPLILLALSLPSLYFTLSLIAPCRKYPQFEQGEIFSLQDAFRKLDVDDKGYLDEGTVIKATQQSERQPYDTVRQTLKEVELDSSRRVELEDYVDVSAPGLHIF